MGFLDVLLGRSRVAGARKDKLLAISTACVTLTTRFQLTPVGKAGVCFKPVDSSFFTEMETELRGLLRAEEKTAGTRFAVKDDDYSYRWVILRDADFEDLVVAVYMVSQAFKDQGFDGQLLAAAFPFRSQGREVYFIYNFKRGRFYPFIPLGKDKERDNAQEMSLASKLEREVPMEGSLELWYGLYGIPFDAV
ncbi:MAG: hypothetical protein HY686_08475 [Chloroflexi bacterium]|nr:hypothetical protein [Chloroflexota bacterium]